MSARRIVYLACDVGHVGCDASTFADECTTLIDARKHARRAGWIVLADGRDACSSCAAALVGE